ncbi:hypothetical protein Leryth_005207 [Lithospermum erythrorhizon]|nr:hypothetical protein Leryth_005207 [Lithospermum erythrorhizon]
MVLSPPSIGRLNSLALLDITHSLISGEIPEEIGQLKELQVLALPGNRFDRKLQSMDLSNNRLTGRALREIFNLQSLSSFPQSLSQ